MQQTISILLLQNTKDGQKMRNYIETLPGITLIASTNDTRIALAHTEQFSPQFVIVNLDLHNKYGTSFDYLSALQQLHMGRKPYVIALTDSKHKETYERARYLGANLIFYSMHLRYTEQTAIDFILQYGIVTGDYMLSETDASTADFQKQVLYKHIKNELDRIGISPKVLGRSYLTDAIMLLVQGNQKTIEVLSKKYNKTPGSIIRAMQTAIQSAWIRTHPEILSKSFQCHVPPDRGYPTLNEFIYYFSDKIKDVIHS